MEQMAPSLEFLPDPMVIEAEWRANPALAQKLEEERAQQERPGAKRNFLRQARFALVLRRLLWRKTCRMSTQRAPARSSARSSYRNFSMLP